MREDKLLITHLCEINYDHAKGVRLINQTDLGRCSISGNFRFYLSRFFVGAKFVFAGFAPTIADDSVWSLLGAVDLELSAPAFWAGDADKFRLGLCHALILLFSAAISDHLRFCFVSVFTGFDE
jgi:hypothetical protein